MALWWASEAIPVSATALLPFLVFPVIGVVPLGTAAGAYAHPLVFLFLGGMLIGESLQRWALHRRIALSLISAVGTARSRIVLGFMAATGVLSMWISNTATAVMMVPIAVSVVRTLAAFDPDEDDTRRFGVALMLGIAYAASFGGIGTLIGTPPNALMAAYFSQTYGVEISFSRWMMFAVPISIGLLGASWLLLTRVLHRDAFAAEDSATGQDKKTSIGQALHALGPLSTPEIRVGAVFLTAALLWVFRPLLAPVPVLGALSDPGIGILCGLALFVVPAGGNHKGVRLLDWDSAQKIPWGILLLFGGGLSLASGISTTDLDTWLGDMLQGARAVPPFIFVIFVAGVILLLTEIASNTATVAALLPVLSVLASVAGMDPLLLAAPAVVAASCAFMLPAATPPNAIVFSSGFLSVAQMMRAGIVINLLSLGVVTAAGWLLIPALFPPIP